jgi:hypothetical protein
MRHILLSVWTYRLVRLALAGAFLLAGAVKLADPAVLAVTIKAFGILPPAWAHPLAVVLPLVEVLAALGLVFDLRGSLGTIAALLLVFIAVLAWGLHLGLDIDCGCYGPADPEAKAFGGLRTAFERDLVMLGGAAFCYFWRYVRRPAQARPEAVYCNFRQP